MINKFKSTIDSLLKKTTILPKDHKEIQELYNDHCKLKEIIEQSLEVYTAKLPWYIKVFVNLLPYFILVAAKDFIIAYLGKK